MQVLEPLPDGSAIKLTIANYKTPSGRSIHKTGIKPDITVHLPEEMPYDGDGNIIDAQLEKALEFIEGLIK